MYTNAHTLINIYIYIQYTYVLKNVFTSVFIHAYTHVYIHAHAHESICTNAHMYIHIFICMFKVYV